MSIVTIFLVGCLVSLLCVAFVVISAVELRQAGKEAEERAQRMATASSR
ncbi:MAG: hypothetical protein ABI565_13480 [Vicinamibacteria bacterium]